MQPVAVNPTGTYRRIPLAPHQMNDRLTRTEDAIVLCHVGVPHVARDEWSLTIDGLVQHPMTLHFDDLRRYQYCEITSVHQCAGNPMQPLEPTQRVCNIRWSGIRLEDVLTESKPKPEALYLWSFGADCGLFGGMAIQPYTKDLRCRSNLVRCRVRSTTGPGVAALFAALDARQLWPCQCGIAGN